MLSLLGRYTDWLHTRWPAGTVEKLPVTQEDGSTNVRGLFIVGDLTGIPLLKFSADTGARAVRAIVADPALVEERKVKGPGALDLLIIGAPHKSYTSIKTEKPMVDIWGITGRGVYI